MSSPTAALVTLLSSCPEERWAEIVAELGEYEIHAVSGSDELARRVEELDRPLLLVDLDHPDVADDGPILEDLHWERTSGVVLLAPAAREERALDALEVGAQDYVLREEADAESVRHALRRAARREERVHALRGREEGVRNLVRQIPGLLWTTDGDLRFTSGHGRGMVALGREPGADLNLAESEFFGVETHRDRILEAHRRALEGSGGRFDISVGGRIFQCFVEPLRPVHDGVEGTVGIGVDVTERTWLDARLWRERERYDRALDSVADAQARLGAVVQNAPVVLFVLDSEGRFVLSEGRGLAALGLQPGEVVGQSIFENFQHYPDVLETVRQVLAGAEVTTVHDLDGVFFDARYAPILDPETGEIEGVIGVATDVTDRVAAESLRRESEERYRVLFENSTDLITVIAADGTIRYESPSVREMLGYDPEELEGTSMMDLVHPEDVVLVLRELDALVDDPERVARVRARIRHRDGGWRVLEAEGRNLLDNPALGGVVVNSRDVTDQQALEEQLHQSQKMEALGRLAGGVAHDFNNLLTVIRGTAQLLRGEERQEEMDRGLAEIMDVSERAADLTRQLLAFSRHRVHAPVRIEIRSVLTRSQTLLRRILGTDIEIEVEAEPDLHVEMDPSRLEQVIVNLAVNARDAMPEGGRLSIRCREVELEEPQPGSHRDIKAGRYVLLSVSDTGIGMSREVQRRVFEPFYTTKEEGEGTGLGLSTVWGIIHQAGGVAHVYSELGEGTSFRIYLPKDEEEGRGRKPGAEPVGEPGTGADEEVVRGTVLLAEDDEMVRSVVRRTLEREGLEVLEAEDGPAAIEIARTEGERIDLLLTDVVMPDMTGPELASCIREILPYLPIIFSSGYGAEEIRVREKQLAHVRIVEKPFDLAHLVQVVREALQNRQRSS